jgi:hypothetical protein
MAALTGDNARGLRDRALVLLGFAGAFRRSELVALNLEDLEFCYQGLQITIRKSETKQEGEGATIAIAPGSFAWSSPMPRHGAILNLGRPLAAGDHIEGMPLSTLGVVALGATHPPRSTQLRRQLLLQHAAGLDDAPMSPRRPLVRRQLEAVSPGFAIASHHLENRFEV